MRAKPACLAFAILSAGLSTVADAALIAERTGPQPFLWFNKFQAIEFTTTSAYTNVAVSAVIGGDAEGARGTMYLMTNIGPGATPADEVAHLALTDIPRKPFPELLPLLPLFSDLTLGPDTYYLVLAQDAGAPEIGFVGAGVSAEEETAAGVSIGLDHLSIQPNELAPYAPASSNQTTDGTGNLFQVTGDELTNISEPASLSIIALALIAWIALRQQPALTRQFRG